MITFIGGTKGGVGKSLVSMLALNKYIQDGIEPVLIETDTANPDVYKAYNGKKCKAYAYDIDTEKGWSSALNVIGESMDKSPIIINSGARNTKTILAYGDVLNELGDMVTLWVINNQLDSLVLLKEYLQTVKQKVCVVKNGFFADDTDFEVFDKSKLKTNGLQSVYLPRATDAIANKLYVERKAIHELSGCLSFGDKLLAKSWINKASDVYSSAINSATEYHG